MLDYGPHKIYCLKVIDILKKIGSLLSVALDLGQKRAYIDFSIGYFCLKR